MRPFDTPWRGALALLILFGLLLAILTLPAQAAERPFAPDSFWNAPLTAKEPVDPASATVVADLKRQVGWGTYVNTTRFSVPVYTVEADAGTTRVRLDRSTGMAGAALQTAFDEVPLPKEAVPAAGSDGHLVVWQPATDRMWEFFNLARDATTAEWHTEWGGYMPEASKSPGYFGDPALIPYWNDPARNWGATASGLALLGGLIRLDELRDGRIDHALAMATTEVRYNRYSWPAQRTDGQRTGAQIPMEGMRFRLPADLDLEALNLPRPTRVIAEAAQRYGLVLRDRTAGGVSLYGEDPTPTGSNPYPTLFAGLSPTKVLASFPWSQLQLLRTEVDGTPPTTTITETPGAVTSADAPRFAFEADDSNVRIQCGMDAIRISTCGGSRSFPDLAEGTHRFWAQAVDRAGLYKAEVRHEFRIDRTRPEQTAQEAPASFVTTPTVRLSFSVSESATTECRVDAGEWFSCSSPAVFTPGDGQHRLAVRSTDEAGNTSDELRHDVLVDTSAPEVRIDAVTSPTRETVSSIGFSTGDASSTDCRLDEGDWAPCTSPLVLAGLPEGAHRLSVRATDEAGNASTAASGEILVDRTAPQAWVAAGPTGPTSARSAAFGLEADEPGGTFECALDLATWQLCGSLVTFVSLGQGPHTLRVRATDAAGNVGSTADPSTWVVDTVAPSTSLYYGPKSGTSTSPTFNFRSSDSTAAFECRLDGGDWAICRSAKWYVRVKPGEHRFEVRARDAAGNVEVSPESWSWTIRPVS